MLACLAEIRPLDLDTGTRTPVRVSSLNDRIEARKVNGLGGYTWEPALVQPPVLGITLWNGDFQAAVQPASAVLPIAMAVARKTYTRAETVCWIGAPVEVFLGVPGDPWPWGRIFRGRVSGYGRKGGTLTLTADVDSEPLRADLLTRAYAGTGGDEGGADLKGKVKPLCIGWPLSVEPVLIDADNSVYQFSAYGTIEAVTKLYERGSDFGAATANYATYAALVAATIAPGRWATCLAEGLIRLGAPAYGVITGDIKGHKVGSTSPRLTGAVVQALATLAGIDPDLIDDATLDALDADVPYPVNLVLTEQTTFLEQAQAMALACNYQSGASLIGAFFVAGIRLDAPDTIEIETRGRCSPQVMAVEEADVSPPYWRTVLGANRAWRVHSADEIAFNAALVERGLYADAETYREGNVVDLPDGSRWLYVNAAATTGNDPPAWPTTSNAWWENLSPPLSAADLSYVDGTPIEDLKPAEAGATEGAPSGTPVGAITADDVDTTVKPGGGVADDQVETESMVDNAAAVTSSLYYNNGGGAIGSSGTYLDLPGGPATVSIATGAKAAQQCQIRALVGLRRGGGGNDFVTLRCRRNDGTILAQTYTQEVTNDQAVIPAAFVDPSPTPSTTHTYTIQITTDDSGTQVREVFVEGYLSKTG